MRLAHLLLPLVVVIGAAGCDTAAEGTIPVIQIVGADLRYDEPLSGPTIEVRSRTREVGRVPAAPCDDIRIDCAFHKPANAVVPDQTRLVADRPVRVGGASVEAGTDLLPLLGAVARLRLSVSPTSVGSFPVREIGFETGRTRLTASWETDDGLAFSATATVRR